jgi:hypothetical protein
MKTIEEAQALAAEQGTRVVHLKVEPYTRRIDRRTLWGNPHPLKGQSQAERTACLLAYVRTLAEDGTTLARVGDLRGEVLGCWCAPRACHGDVLATLASVDTVEERRSLLRQWEQLLRQEVDRG